MINITYGYLWAPIKIRVINQVWGLLMRSCFNTYVLYKYQVHWKQRFSMSYYFFFLFRVASMIQQFTSGLNSCGRLWEVVLNNWTAFLPLFTNTRGPLTRNEFRDLFNIVWSSPGSNRRDLEEETVFQWECWLMLIQGKCFLNCTLFCNVILFCFMPFTFCFTHKQKKTWAYFFEDVLMFVTAADSVPPLGFQQMCKVEFYDQEEPTRRIPYASTCTLTLYLPRGVSEEEEFRDLMFLAIKGSLGFGKV